MFPANVRGSPYLLTLSRLSRFLSTTLATEAKYPVRDRAVVCLLTFGDECTAFFAFGRKLENNRVGIVHHCCILPLVCGSCSGLLRLTHRRFSPCGSRTCSVLFLFRIFVLRTTRHPVPHAASPIQGSTLRGSLPNRREARRSFFLGPREPNLGTRSCKGPQEASQPIERMSQ